MTDCACRAAALREPVAHTVGNRDVRDGELVDFTAALGVCIRVSLINKPTDITHRLPSIPKHSTPCHCYYDVIPVTFAYIEQHDFKMHTNNCRKTYP